VGGSRVRGRQVRARQVAGGKKGGGDGRRQNPEKESEDDKGLEGVGYKPKNLGRTDTLTRRPLPRPKHLKWKSDIKVP